MPPCCPSAHAESSTSKTLQPNRGTKGHCHSYMILLLTAGAIVISGGRPQIDSMRRVIMVCATAAVASCAAEQPAPDYAAAAARLDEARAEIAPPLGATTYTLDHRRLVDQPGDENRTLGQALQQRPGVSLGPNGQLRVRGQ